MIRVKSKIDHYLEYSELVDLAKSQSNKKSKQDHVLVSLDIDNFNYINDLFGYAVGDAVLKRFAEYLSETMQEGEYFCHLHADQYVLWLPIQEEKEAFTLMDKYTNVKKALSTILPFHYHIVFSCGIVRVGTSNETFSTMIDKANYARKKAKGAFETTFLYYDESMAKDMEWLKGLTLMMDKALKEKEFIMYLQPKVIIRTGEIVGAEALVRWNSSVLGMIQPNRFIPIMERNGFIRQLDFYMLKEACKYLKKGKEAGEKILPISVNFSKVHLRDDNFISDLHKIVNVYDIRTDLIEIEFTENMYEDDFALLIETAKSLKELGFKVALDDFGSAYSSLNCLKDIPLDVIKIDRSFFGLTANSDKGRIIIAKMVELIKSLKMTPVMEGIEEKEQVDFLKKLNCDMGQGFYYAKPMPAVRFGEYVQEQIEVKTKIKVKGKKILFH